MVFIVLVLSLQLLFKEEMSKRDYLCLSIQLGHLLVKALHSDKPGKNE